MNLERKEEERREVDSLGLGDKIGASWARVPTTCRIIHVAAVDQLSMERISNRTTRVPETAEIA